MKIILNNYYFSINFDQNLDPTERLSLNESNENEIEG